MKQRLTERYVIDLMKEEWDKKVRSFVEKKEKKTLKKNTNLEVNVDVDGDGHKENVISPGLKVRKKQHDPNGKKYNSSVFDSLVYEVESADGKEVVLSRIGDDGQKKILKPITVQDFEDNYERK